MIDQCALPGGVALVHRADLRNGDVGLVNNQKEVLREVVEQRVGRRARGAAINVHGVVLHARARTNLTEHLEVVRGPHAQALSLQELAVALQDGQALGQFGLNALNGSLKAFGPGDVMGGGEDKDLVGGGDDVPGHGMEGCQRLDLISEELDADGELLVHGDDLHGVPPYPEGSAGEIDIIARVLHGDEAAQKLVAVDLVPHGEWRHAVDILLGRAQAVDAGDRGDDDDVAAGQQGVGGAVA